MNTSKVGKVHVFGMLVVMLAAFQIVYAQSAMLSAGAVSMGDFDPGQGLRWQLEWEDPDGTSDTLFTEQALLTRDGEGEWWYISLSDDEYEIEYEYFVSTEDTVTELLYRDSTMAETRRAAVTVSLAGMREEEDLGTFYQRIDSAEHQGDYQVQRRRESVTVPAGAFDAEVYHVEGSDPDSGEQIDSTWWRVETVPGDTVRFEYRTDTDQIYRGVLFSYDDDYRRSL